MVVFSTVKGGNSTFLGEINFVIKKYDYKIRKYKIYNNYLLRHCPFACFVLLYRPYCLGAHKLGNIFLRTSLQFILCSQCSPHRRLREHKTTTRIDLTYISTITKNMINSRNQLRAKKKICLTLTWNLCCANNSGCTSPCAVSL